MGIENKIFDKIKESIEKSTLEKADKENFISVLSEVTNQSELENLAMLFSESETWVGVLYDNYKDKKQALEEKDEKKWDKIMKDEVSMLESTEE